MSSEEKEVKMDFTVQEGSGKRRARKSRRSTKGKEQDQEEQHSVTKASPSPSPSPSPSRHTAHTTAHTAAHTAAHTPAKPVTPAKVIVAPPKKRPTKLLLVPKTVKIAISSKKKAISKTFKAKRVRLTIDNSSKTRKRRSTIVSSIDALTDDQVRAAAVKAKLSSRESVNKAPIALLKQIIKDYQIMKGMLL